MKKQYFLLEVNPQDAVAVIENEITPVIEWATEWGITTGFGILGVLLFYRVIIIIVVPK